MLSCVQLLQPYGLLPARLFCPWNSPGRILQWVAFSFPRGSSRPRIKTLSLVSIALQAFFFFFLSLSHQGSPLMYICSQHILRRGFACSSVGKESACNAGDPSLILGSGRCPGEGIGYPFQYSWASLVAQLVKNLPAMWETWVRSLGWEDPLEKGKATYTRILAWRIPWTRPCGPKELDMMEQLSLSLF